MQYALWPSMTPYKLLRPVLRRLPDITCMQDLDKLSLFKEGLDGVFGGDVPGSVCLPASSFLYSPGSPLAPDAPPPIDQESHGSKYITESPLEHEPIFRSENFWHNT